MNDIAGVPTIIPVLAVEDIQSAINFYNHLGFREVFSIPDQSGKLAHAHLRKGDSDLFLGRLDVSHYGGHRRAETIGGSRSTDRGIGITLILQVDNLASVYGFVYREKLEVLAEPLDEYYGDRVFLFPRAFWLRVENQPADSRKYLTWPRVSDHVTAEDGLNRFRVRPALRGVTARRGPGHPE